MNRIDHIFHDRRQRGKKTLMPFLTAGDPDLATTAQLLGAVQQAGASICELGIAFSDPIADGPVIQASMAHALGQGVGPGQVLEVVAGVRSQLEMGLVAMVSYSIVYRFGLKRFVRQAAQAGIDGLIFPDLPLEESAGAQATAGAAGLICSLLIAPTTPVDRAKRIAEASSGFVYLLARAGLTGEQSALPPDLGPRIEALRAVTDLPIAVGFGVSNPQQVAAVTGVADAAIVGSAIMRRIAQQRDQGQTSQAITQGISRFVNGLAQALHPHTG